MIQDNKLLRCTVVAPRLVYESSFWTSKDVYTKRLTITPTVLEVAAATVR